MTCSFVIPVHNEEQNLPGLMEEIAAVRGTLPGDSEVIFVNDGSTDASARELEAIRLRHPGVVIVEFAANAGQSAALSAGFQEAAGEIIITLDADLQNDPADIPRLLAQLERGFDAVSGVRVERHDSWVRRASSRIANAVRNWATDERITDVGCSLKVYRREFHEHLPMFTGMHRFLPTLVRWYGATVAELPVRHRPRRHGVAKYGIGNRLFRALADLFQAVRWMRTRWIDPANVEELAPDGEGRR